MQAFSTLAVRQVRSGGDGLYFACWLVVSAARPASNPRKVSATARASGRQGGFRLMGTF